jgi:hypothetical protein
VSRSAAGDGCGGNIRALEGVTGRTGAAAGGAAAAAGGSEGMPSVTAGPEAEAGVALGAGVAASHPMLCTKRKQAAIVRHGGQAAPRLWIGFRALRVFKCIATMPPVRLHEVERADFQRTDPSHGTIRWSEKSALSRPFVVPFRGQRQAGWRSIGRIAQNQGRGSRVGTAACQIDAQ